MKGSKFLFLAVVFFLGAMILPVGFLPSGESGNIPTDAIRNAFREILAASDKNDDGKLSMNECLAMSSDRARMEKNCRYWDLNSDGIIIEDEYVKQVLNIGARQGHP